MILLIVFKIFFIMDVDKIFVLDNGELVGNGIYE